MKEYYEMCIRDRGYKKIKEQFPGVFEETDKQIEKQEPETALALKYL